MQFASRYKVCRARNRDYLFYNCRVNFEKRMHLYLVIITGILTLETALGSFMFTTLNDVLR